MNSVSFFASRFVVASSYAIALFRNDAIAGVSPLEVWPRRTKAIVTLKKRRMIHIPSAVVCNDEGFYQVGNSINATAQKVSLCLLLLLTREAD